MLVQQERRSQTVRWLLGLVACLFALVVAPSRLGTAPAGANPLLSLEPDRGPCTGRIVVRGGDLPPHQAVALIAYRPGGGNARHLRSMTVSGDGTISSQVDVREFAGECGGQAPPSDVRYIIAAVTDRGSSLGGQLVRATFTVSPSPAPLPGLPNTGGGGAHVAALWSPGAARAAAPVLIVTPERGSCDSRFVARGELFPPGELVTLVFRVAGAIPHHLATLSATVAPDGTFAIEIFPAVIDCLPTQPQGPERQYEVFAQIGFRAGDVGTLVATTAFTVSPSSSSPAPVPSLPRAGGGWGAAPTLALEPDRGSCAARNPFVRARGSGYAPGQNVALAVRQVGSGSGVIDAEGTVAADGSFVLWVRVAGCGPDTREGAQFRVYVHRVEGPLGAKSDAREVLADALFTADPAAPPPPGPPPPTLALQRDRGPCGDRPPVMELRGADFPPGQWIAVIAGRDGERNFRQLGDSIIVPADGTFALVAPLLMCGPGEPAGTDFRIIAGNGFTLDDQSRPVGDNPVAASAIFTVASFSSPPSHLPNAGGGGMARQAASPVLTLEPDQAPCDVRNLPIVVRGQGFPPGQTIALFSGPVRGHGGVAFAGLPVPADGAFAFEVNLGLLGIACGIGGIPPDPDGTQYRILAYIDPGRGSVTSGAVLATALFTVASSATLPPASPDTDPLLTLTPARGSCLDRIVARGARFPAGWAVSLTAVQTGPGSGRSPAYRVIARPIAAPDGTFAVEFALPPVAPHGCGQCGAGGCGADPTGEAYTITAIVDRAPGDPRVAVARAAFTVTSPALPPAAVPRAGGGARGQTGPPWRLTLGLLALALAGGVSVVGRRAAGGR